MTITRLTLLGTLLLTAACGNGAAIDAGAAHAPVTIPLTEQEKQGVLALVNDCETSASILDIDAALDRRAATNIVDHRDGSDTSCGSDDDDLFDDLDELDAISYVGDAALQRLLAYALAQGYLSDDAVIAFVEGVAFTAAEIAGVLDIVNQASLETLDVEIGLDARAARGIVAVRPIASLEQLAAVPYVGARALQRLKDHLAVWQGNGCLPLGGEFEGVLYSDEQAHDVLDLSNHGELVNLQQISGIGPALSAAIAGLRPFASVAELGAVGGIGGHVLTNLRDQTATLWCGNGIALCGCGNDPAPLPEEEQSYDGVSFTASQEQTALAILNTATRGQLRADAGFSKGEANVTEQGRPWASLQAFADTSGIGATLLGALRTYVDGGLWSGPGPMQRALTIAELTARASELNGSFISFNSVLATTSQSNAVFEAMVQDAAGDTVSVRLYKYLCNVYTDNCVAPPPIHIGEQVELLHVKVELYNGRLSLRMVDTSEVTPLGCWSGWSRDCGMDVGVCSVGSETCGDDGWSACSGLTAQQDSDLPDGLDNDCDGRVDENSFNLTEIAHLADPVRAFSPAGATSLAASPDQLLRIDLDDPTQPTIMAQQAHSDVGGPRLRRSGDRLVLAACRSGVRIYSATATDFEPLWDLAPTLTASTVGCVTDAVLVGDTLYTADWYNGVFGFDLSGDTPVQILHIATTPARAIEVRGQHLIVLDNNLWVYDLTDTSTPVQGPFHGGRDMAISDTGLIAVADHSGLYLFDAASPAQVSSFPVIGVASWHLAWQGNLLVAGPMSGDRLLRVLQVDGASAAQVVAEVVVPNPNNVVSGSALDGVLLDGDQLYAWGGTGLHIFDLLAE